MYCRVLCKQIVIETPKQFAESIIPGINVLFVDTSELDLSHHRECREKAKYIYGTLKVHFVNRIIDTNKNCNLQFYSTSLSAELINEVTYECQAVIPTVGEYYTVEYEGRLWPGVVTDINLHGSVKVNCLHKVDARNASIWKWPVTPEHDYPLCDIKELINTPKLLPGGSRNIIFEIPELKNI